MKLYYVERTDQGGYDTYSDFVCWANSEEEARQTNPDDFYIWKDDGWFFSFSDDSFKRDSNDSWVEDPKTLKVWELSRPPEKATVVCASFHAG